MKALRRAREGEGKYYPVNVLGEPDFARFTELKWKSPLLG